MTEHQFDARLAHIEEQYQARREGATAYRDQEMARLFEECDWGQEKIAARMGKRKSWVSYRLKFGAFLGFSTSGGKHPSWLMNLTERRFREHWKRTKGREAERFAQVAHALEHGVPHGYEAMIDKPGIVPAVLECLADGRWYTVQQITATVEESLPGLTCDQVSSALTKTIRRRPPAGKRLESKLIGRKAQYRLVKTRAAQADKPEVVLAVYEQIKPLIDELYHWGKQYSGMVAPGEIKIIAHKLEKIFERLLTKEKA
jgi:hypothetical protein